MAKHPIDMYIKAAWEPFVQLFSVHAFVSKGGE